jgi:hypothetical protein
MAGIVPSQSAFGKRNDSRVTSAILTRDSVSYSKAAFSSRNTGCPDGAYGRYGGTALRPRFADQISRHIVCISRSVLFLRMAAFRIRRRSFSSLCVYEPLHAHPQGCASEETLSDADVLLAFAR